MHEHRPGSAFSRLTWLLGRAAVPRRGYGIVGQTLHVTGGAGVGSPWELTKIPRNRVTESSHVEVLCRKSFGAVSSPPYEGRVVHLGQSQGAFPRGKRGWSRDRQAVRTYVGPFGMMVLDLALQGDGRHEILRNQEHSQQERHDPARRMPGLRSSTARVGPSRGKVTDAGAGAGRNTKVVDIPRSWQTS